MLTVSLLKLLLGMLLRALTNPQPALKVIPSVCRMQPRLQQRVKLLPCSLSPLHQNGLDLNYLLVKRPVAW